MGLPDIRPTAQQVAQLDQKAADLAAVAQLIGMFRSALLAAGFSDEEAFGLVSRLYGTVLTDGVEFDDDRD